jgi:hypothetical protein
MDTINTIITNAQTLSQAEVNWSLDAGPIWLVGMVAGWLALSVVFGVQEVRRERRMARQALYRKAMVKANIRLNRMERQGFQEIM